MSAEVSAAVSAEVSAEVSAAVSSGDECPFIHPDAEAVSSPRTVAHLYYDSTRLHDVKSWKSAVLTFLTFILQSLHFNLSSSLFTKVSFNSITQLFYVSQIYLVTCE